MKYKPAYLIMLGMFLTASMEVVSMSYAAESTAGYLKKGKRLLVQAEGRKDYKPKIVECDSSSIGLCLRDTRGTPANNPLEPHEGNTLKVTFGSWDITYLISEDGTGRVLDGDGNELGPFNWSLQ